MNGKMKVVRGPYLECWIIAPGKTKPAVIIQYGNGRSKFTNYDEAERFAKSLLKNSEMKKALVAIKDLLDEKREDFETVYKMIEEALA